MNLENMLRGARKGFNHVLDDLADFTPRRLRHTLAAGAMLFMLYSCGGSSGGGGNGGNGTPAQCNDGKDNDGDGYTDMKDPGCTSKTDDSEYNAPVNNPPIVSSTFNPVSLAEDSATSVALAGHFSDPDGDALTYSVNGFADVIAAVAGNQINISAPANYNGTDSGNVKACDTSNACVSTPLGVTFTPVNDIPEILGLIMTTSQENQFLDGYVNVREVDGEAVECWMSSNGGLPELVINADCTVTSTVPLPYDSAGSYSPTAWAEDAISASPITTMTLNVANTNQVPVITDVTIDQNPPQEGQTLTGLVYRVDDDGDYASCSLVTSTLPQIRVTSTGSIYSCTAEPCDSLSPDPLPAGTAGPQSLEVICCDPFECGTNYTRNFEVNGPPTTPTTDVINYGVFDNAPFPLEFDVYGSVDPNGDSIIYGVIALPPGALFSATTGHFSWDPTCTQDGVYTPSFYAEDIYGAQSGLHNIVITVNDGC